MSNQPKLKIKRSWDPTEEICELENARHSLFQRVDIKVFVEGDSIRSYDELVRFAAREEYKDKAFLDVWLVTQWPAGG